MESRILAIDIGTSSTKGLVIDASGGVHDTKTVDYPLLTPEPGAAEQDPDEILRAVRAVLTELGGDGIPVVLSSVMHSLLAVGEDGRPASHSWTWADRRAAAAAESLRAGGRARGLHERNGTPLHPMSPLCKLVHLSGTQPDLVRRSRFLSIKEYVTEQLTGERWVDHSVASSSGLFDVRKLAWDPEALELAGVRAAQLSEPVPTTHVIAADRPFVIGATDGVLANLGVGAVEPDTPCITLGTSGAARLVVDEPRTDPSGKLFCYVLDEGRWVVGAAVNNGGLVLRWMRDALCGGAVSDEALLTEAAGSTQAGLVMVPTLTGDRYPSYRTDGSGILVGLTLAHGRGDILRAGIEGVMLAFAPLMADLRAGGAAFDTVRIGGGVFGHAFCRQLLADVLGIRVAMPASSESSALGAARLGFRALGIAADWDTALPILHEPDLASHGRYRELGEIREQLLEAIDLS